MAYLRAAQAVVFIAGMALQAPCCSLVLAAVPRKQFPHRVVSFILSYMGLPWVREIVFLGDKGACFLCEWGSWEVYILGSRKS